MPMLVSFATLVLSNVLELNIKKKNILSQPSPVQSSLRLGRQGAQLEHRTPPTQTLQS